MSQSNGAGNDTGNDWKSIAPILAWVAALGAVTVASLVFFYLALDRLIDDGEKKKDEGEKRVSAELGRYLKEQQGVSCPGTWAISRPVLFRRGVANEVADQVDKKSIHRFMMRPAVRKAPKVYVFGFASADGPSDVNDRLALQRAQTVKAIAQKYHMDVEKHGLGENHLTQGVADSRSARIVACDCGHDTEPTEPEKKMWTRLCTAIARLAVPRSPD